MNYLTKETIEDVRNIINAALANVEGIDFTVGKIKYNSESAQISLEGIVSGGRSKIEQALENAMDQYQINGTKFIVQGKTFNLTGYKKANWKYPFIATSTDGKSYKFNLNSVMNGQLRDAKPVNLEQLAGLLK